MSQTGGTFPTTFSVVDTHGTVVYPTFEDSNGNGPDGTGRNYAIQLSSATTSIGSALPGSVVIPGLGSAYNILYQTVNPSSVELTYSLTSGAPTSACLKQSYTVGGTSPPFGFSVPQSLSIPGGQQYNFGHDSTYGFINKITYPTGATVSYTWSPLAQVQSSSFSFNTQSSQSNCSFRHDWMGITKRVASFDGVNPAMEQDFTYQTNWSGTSNVWTSKVTTVITKDLTPAAAPALKTVYTFLPSNMGQGQLLDGQSLSDIGPIAHESTIQYVNNATGQVLLTLTRTWASASLLSAECTTLPNGKMAGTFYQYEGITDQKTDVAEYDYGLGSCVAPNLASQSPGTAPTPSPTAARETITAYQTFPATPMYPTGPSILDRPSTVKVYGRGVLVSETDFVYDEGTPMAVTAPIDHDKVNYEGASAVKRGNATTIIKRCFPASQSCTDSITHVSYDTTGQPISITDPDGHPPTTLSYADNYTADDGLPSGNTNTYVTKVTGPSVNGANHVSNYRYGFNDGKLRSWIDENSKTTTFCYWAGGCSGSRFDPWLRLTQTIDPLGGGSTTTYSDAGPSPNATTSILATPDPSVLTKTILDGVGHTVERQLSSVSGTIYVDTPYDGFGRVAKASNPYRSSSDVTYGWTLYNYDPLGRPLTQTQPDSSLLQWSYNSNVTTFLDEAHHSWQRTSDALGRLTNVVEPTGAATGYTYDALGNLLTVNQNGISGETPRVRGFVYDSLSRLTSSTNPETGTIGYIYDNNGNVIRETDARGIAISYGYDALNRMKTKSSSGGNGVPGFNYLYGYDSTTPTTEPNGIGRLLFTTTSPGALGGIAEQYFYDAMGRMTSQSTYSPSGASASVSAVYDLAGNVTQWTYPDGRVVHQTWDGGGHVSSITDNNGGFQYMTSQSTYWPNGAPQATWRGNGVATGVQLNNRLQPWAWNGGRIVASAPSNRSLYLKEACYGPATASPAPTILPACPALSAGNNGNIWKIFDGLVSGSTQSFGYDSLNRLASFAQADGTMQQTYGYDSFGNVNQTGTLQSSLGFNANNRISSGGYGYDGSGNVTSVFNGISTIPYSYDAENKLASVNNGAAVYTYDADGNRGRKDVASAWQEYVLFNGQTLAERNDDGTWSDYIFANGQRMARVDNYDIRIHMSGTNCSGCGSTNTFAGTQSLTGANGTVIRDGDVLTWRQYQSGVARGGISVAFDNSTVGTSGVVTAEDGQLADADTRTGAWYQRVLDLSNYVGKTLSVLNLYNYQGGAAGNWNIWVGDISLVHSDGTFVPIYYRTMTGLSQFSPGAAESNVVVTTEKLPDNTSLNTAFYHHDQVGSSILLTDFAGWPVSSSIYYPFGQEQAPQLVPPSGSGNHYRFTGKERDSESGLDYFGARYYASNMGRWMSPDWADKPEAVPYFSLDNPQSLNLYAYVGNNPLSHSDADGHCDQNGQNCSTWDHIAGAVGGLLNVVPMTLNIPNQIFNAVSGALGGPQVTELPMIQSDTHASVGGLNTGAAAQILLPVGDLAKGAQLADSALVVRGGVATTEQLTKGAETVAADGKLSGISVQSANGASVQELSSGLKNNQVSVTTAGAIRAYSSLL